MRGGSLLAALTATSAVSAVPSRWLRFANKTDANPFDGKKLFANPDWAKKLEKTYSVFKNAGDDVNAAKVRTVQQTGSFVWIAGTAGLSGIDTAIEAARAEQASSGTGQMVGLVMYNLPDRDCSGGESAGEYSSANGGLELYKTDFIDPYAAKVGAASDLTFAIVIEPDSLGNVITNQGVDFCAKATPAYEEGIAYALASLQFPNVHLYIDAAHGGWLGWDGNLPLAAAEFAKVVKLAGNSTKIRGFVTNVSNFNPFQATVRENYTEWSHSWDESHYISSLAPYLEAQGLPSRFIVDQGRVALNGARKDWGEWCNVAPAGFGAVPGTSNNNTHVDSIVWVKPGGESDGECGMAGAPRAGAWFEEYAEMLVKNADSSVGLTIDNSEVVDW